MNRIVSGNNRDGVSHYSCGCVCHDRLMASIQGDKSGRVREHLQEFCWLTQNNRHDYLYNYLLRLYIAGPDGAMEQNYVVFGNPVCKEVFHWFYPVSLSTLDRILADIRRGTVCALRDDRRGMRHSNRGDRSANFVAWVLALADATGDQLPEAGTVGRLYLPRMTHIELHEQYVADCLNAGVPKGDVLSYHSSK